MTLARTAVGLVLLSSGTLLGTLPAQDDEVLLVERGVDRAGRDRMVRWLATKRVDLVAEAMDAKELAERLHVGTGAEVNFLVMGAAGREAGWPALTMELRGRSALNLMQVVRSATDVRFVWFAGAVVMKPKDVVKELKVLRTYDVRAATAPIKSHPGPRLGLGDDGFDLLDDPDDGATTTASGFSIDGLQDLIREHVSPESWDEDGNTISAGLSGTLMIRTTERNQRAVERLLIQVGAIQPPRVIVRRSARTPRPPVPPLDAGAAKTDGPGAADARARRRPTSGDGRSGGGGRG